MKLVVVSFDESVDVSIIPTGTKVTISDGTIVISGGTVEVTNASIRLSNHKHPVAGVTGAAEPL